MIKTYLGDGVYAMFDGFSIVLTTSDGVTTTNTIVLEPEVYSALEQFVARLTKSSAFPEALRKEAQS